MDEYAEGGGPQSTDVVGEEVQADKVVGREEEPMATEKAKPDDMYAIEDEWRETNDRVRMTAPGHPRFVITLDRTYYNVDLVEANGGMRGEIRVHPGHVRELLSVEGGGVHGVIGVVS